MIIFINITGFCLLIMLLIMGCFQNDAEPKGVSLSTSSTAQIFRDRLQDGSLGPEMAWIPAGRFWMGDIQGSGHSDEKPVHWVNVKPFAMGKYEVTVGEYLRFVQATGTHTPEWLEKGNESNIHTGRDNSYQFLGSALTDENHPIVGVSWYNAVAYTEWLTQQTGNPYRLPTEAEWEYAARAGTETEYWWGNEIGFKYKPNCYKNCGDFKFISLVGSFVANPFGLYDMVGNVWEWTCSEYEASYKGKEKYCLGKKPSNNKIQLVTRSGSLIGGAWGMCAAGRDRGWPSDRDPNLGFRLARN